MAAPAAIGVGKLIYTGAKVAGQFILRGRGRGFSAGTYLFIGRIIGREVAKQIARTVWKYRKAILIAAGIWSTGRGLTGASTAYLEERIKNIGADAGRKVTQELLKRGFSLQGASSVGLAVDAYIQSNYSIRSLVTTHFRYLRDNDMMSFEMKVMTDITGVTIRGLESIALYIDRLTRPIDEALHNLWRITGIGSPAVRIGNWTVDKLLDVEYKLPGINADQTAKVFERGAAEFLRGVGIGVAPTREFFAGTPIRALAGVAQRDPRLRGAMERARNIIDTRYGVTVQNIAGKVHGLNLVKNRMIARVTNFTPSQILTWARQNLRIDEARIKRIADRFGAFRAGVRMTNEVKIALVDSLFNAAIFRFRNDAKKKLREDKQKGLEELDNQIKAEKDPNTKSALVRARNAFSLAADTAFKGSVGGGDGGNIRFKNRAERNLHNKRVRNLRSTLPKYRVLMRQQTPVTTGRARRSWDTTIVVGVIGSTDNSNLWATAVSRRYPRSSRTVNYGVQFRSDIIYMGYINSGNVFGIKHEEIGKRTRVRIGFVERGLGKVQGELQQII